MTDAKRQLIRHTAAVNCPLSVLAASLDTTAKSESNSSSGWTAVKFSRDGKREAKNKQPVPYSHAQKEDHLAYNERCVSTSLVLHWLYYDWPMDKSATNYNLQVCSLPKSLLVMLQPTTRLASSPVWIFCCATDDLS